MVSAMSTPCKEKHLNSPGETTLLDAGSLPVEDLATLALREGRRPRPVYQAHRWFARRFGSVFRAILTAAALPAESNFWDGYYEGPDWRGHVVLDPFVGGGTSVVEASRLGANVIGIDVDAVACAITRFETRLPKMPNLDSALAALKSQVGKALAPYYRTITPEGEAREVLHYFWVQVVECCSCGQLIEAHPHFQLGYEAEGTMQWAFCPNCHDVQELHREESELRCKRCDISMPIQQGPVYYGRLTCPHCQSQERLIDVASRTEQSPIWRLFALEIMEPPLRKRLPLKQRRFLPAKEHDQAVLRLAKRALEVRRRTDGTLSWIPARLIPKEGRFDDRLWKYGYDRYHELFNARQLLHLSLLAEAIDQLEEPAREAMGIAFSDHLTTNCMMTQYAFGWRRLSPLFSVRAYRHVTRPVEINPWIDGTGRGTFPNAVRQVQRAIDAARSPKEPLLEGGFRDVEDHTVTIDQPTAPSVRILHRNSETLGCLEDNSIDFVLTDPPYFDNIAYSELSDFFFPWLQQFGLVPAGNGITVGLHQNLAAKGRGAEALDCFQRSLGNCFSEISRVLKSRGRLVFTYQHQTTGAWYALASAVAGLGLRTLQLFPLLGDSGSGLHKRRNTSSWDAVFVMTKARETKNASELGLSASAAQAACEHYTRWTHRLRGLDTGEFGEADRRNFYRACLVAGALGMFSDPEDSDGRPLSELLHEDPPDA
jgi:adenine-specific DNA methylase